MARGCRWPVANGEWMMKNEGLRHQETTENRPAADATIPCTPQNKRNEWRRGSDISWIGAPAMGRCGPFATRSLRRTIASPKLQPERGPAHPLPLTSRRTITSASLDVLISFEWSRRHLQLMFPNWLRRDRQSSGRRVLDSCREIRRLPPPSRSTWPRHTIVRLPSCSTRDMMPTYRCWDVRSCPATLL